ncbi:glycosyltransferase family 4 protein [Algibacter sp. TI.3.09]|uniref:glycosyltransferase family 4 protein n=1 Tax=Algibacter sp. TI.3.09 TaxID=3121298 RepID=UPI00311EF0A0
MRLLYITNQISGSGGLERVLSIKANYLADNLGYDVHIITLNQKDKALFYKFSNSLTYHNITISGNPIKYLLSYRSSIKSIVKSIKPDVISVCDDGLKGFFTPSIIGYPCPMVYERHASINIFKNKDKLNFLNKLKFSLLRKLMHIGAKKYQVFVVLTNENLKEWHLNNLQVIPNPLSFYPEQKSTLKNKKIITVGNHGFQKGYDRLLKTWKIIANKHPNWKLEIYGKIDKKRLHIHLASTLGITNSVSFFEPVKDIQSKYLEASLYVMSSRSEGFGMVLIEAMACGLPCVSFDCPSGPVDIITNNKDGFLVENGNISMLSKRIDSLLSDYQLREEMGLEARQKAKLYLPEIIVPNWDRLFKALTK